MGQAVVCNRTVIKLTTVVIYSDNTMDSRVESFSDNTTSI